MESVLREGELLEENHPHGLTESEPDYLPKREFLEFGSNVDFVDILL